MNAPTDLSGRALPRAGLQRDRGHTLGEQLAARFADRIATRALPPGARLPSVRECARQQGVSPSTVAPRPRRCGHRPCRRRSTPRP
jgi:DNA-binding transcriptional MocR family regulator